mgnify:CR=1 FL=1
MDKTKKRRIQILAASVFWLGVWQAAAVAIGQEVFLVSPVQAIGTLVELLPQAEFWQRIGFSAGRILLGFGLGALSSAVLAVAAEKWEWVDALLAPVMQLVKAPPVASFIILALVWVSGRSLSILISFLMVLPVLLLVACWFRILSRKGSYLLRHHVQALSADDPDPSREASLSREG